MNKVYLTAECLFVCVLVCFQSVKYEFLHVILITVELSKKPSFF